MRCRLGAGASLTILMSGLLTAIGLAVVVLGFACLVLVFVSGTAAARALPTHVSRLRPLGRGIATGVLARSGRALAGSRTGLRRARELASSVLAWLRLRGPRLTRVCADHASQSGRYLARSGKAGAARVRDGVERLQRPQPEQSTQPIDLHRAALRLNASGTRHRRNGAHAQAVELHRRALEILQELGDRRAVALTQNNLALALSHVGEDGDAIEMFEEAAATLRELGEEEHEGRIIANLGLTHRRRGRYEQSEKVLQLALTKLAPASKAYETVEAEVRRAS
jgi:tetratricopeptide (TPR) repeat protein